MAYVKIDFNLKTQKYETTHSGITYCIPYSLVKGFRTYFARYSSGNNGVGISAQWYSDLPAEDKKLVDRLGLQLVKDDFTPDVQPED
jgi:hypothetical protein